MEMQKGANPQYLDPVLKSFIAQLHAPKRAEPQNQLTPELTPDLVNRKTGLYQDTGKMGVGFDPNRSFLMSMLFKDLRNH
jgi:hypothetical protein